MMDRLFLFGFSNAVSVTLLALLVMGISKFARQPAFIHALWLLVLLKFLAPPCLSVPLPLSATTRLDEPVPTSGLKSKRITPRTVLKSNTTNVRGRITKTLATRATGKDTVEGSVEEIASRQLTSADTRGGESWIRWLAFLWILGSASWFALLLVRTRRFGSLLRRAERAPPEIVREVESFSARIGLRHVPNVRVIDAAVPPLTWAMASRPVILLPIKLLTAMSDDERATLIAHELSHLYRRDHWVRRLETIVSGLYWWHPVVGIARRHLHEAAESCCDGCVLSWLPDKGQAYAKALMRSIDFIAESPGRAPVGSISFAQPHFVKRRLQMILQEETTFRMSVVTKIGLVLFSAVVLPVSVFAVSAETSNEQQSNHYSEERITNDVKETSDSVGVNERLNRLEQILATISTQMSQLHDGLQKEDALPEPAKQSATETDVETRSDDSVFRNMTLQAERELSRLLQEAKSRLANCEANNNRRVAARQELGAIEAAYNGGTATLDRLLDAQRRLNDTETAFALSVYNLDQSQSPQGKMHLLALQLKYAKQARDQAVSTWRKIYELHKEGVRGGEAEAEAQAREQYFFFRERAEQARTNLIEHNAQHQGVIRTGRPTHITNGPIQN